ncbi:MAG: AAA family ATPase [Dysgonamonadaceae bacterium]|jgi:superfamily I DNA and/or RNA helicase|nr:AAA family ATPase [Dysgonamonadaceae bacterium]
MDTIKTLRIIFKEAANDRFRAETIDGKTLTVICNKDQQEELSSLRIYLQPGTIFNLLNAKEIEPGIFETGLFILEPDYLIDISSLAECFRPYGHHPLNYILARVHPVENTQHILLGNTANFFIDELVNEKRPQSTDYQETLKKLFKSSPFEFSACEDLKKPGGEQVFFMSCKKHFEHIRESVLNLFPKANIDRDKAVLEPSFICNTLGIQGRLDLVLNDFSAFVELKSGKAVEDYRTGGPFIHSAANHYTQMILYLAVLEFNLDLDADTIRSYLLYSKYPVLSKEKHSRKQLKEALRLRNAIVAIESGINRQNDPEYTESILNNIRAEVLNTEQLKGNFFEHYLRPSIDRFGTSLDSLDNSERAYFMRLYTFINKELWLSKTGEREYEGISRAANLWNACFEDKLAAGEILYNLKITDNRADSEEHTVILEIPEYDDLYLPNFRPGDAVVLYERNTKADNVNNKQVFKGAIEALNENKTIIRLRFRQRNTRVWHNESLYALEHDYMDSTYTGMFRALSAFLDANRERRDLLLCRRMPETNQSINQDPECKNDVERAVKKAVNTKDCFLLVGPPGTGKTSLALKQIVEASLQENKTNILLLSYTNRAVDEICKALVSISDHLPFMRIGNELNCSPEYRKYLLDNLLDKCNRRSEVQQVIEKCRICVGTVASVWNKPDIFKLKSFNIAVVDEATQLLEPHLLGILCAKTSTGENAVKRFVLIGDHKQLPAVVLQTTEDSQVKEPVLTETGITNLGNSLFERLYRKYRDSGLKTAYDTLFTQGRMHPEIAAFPSLHFYNNQLLPAGLPHQKEIWNEKNMAFYAVRKQSDDHSDKTNREEATVVVNICKQLLDQAGREGNIFMPESIGIITPYRNQIALIRKLLQETGIQSFSTIIVDTIERFQGSQRDTIIYSFCVNAPWQLDTLPCLTEEKGTIIDRKLNVVLTRARKRLFLTGNELLLSQNKIFRELIRHIAK